jgi:hypothetical protein
LPGPSAWLRRLLKALRSLAYLPAGRLAVPSPLTEHRWPAIVTSRPPGVKAPATRTGIRLYFRRLLRTMSSMEQFATHRRAWLSVILLLILALSALAAWWLVDLRRAPNTRGEAILTHIRAQRLAHYWGPQAATQWYLVQDPNGQAAGYVVRTRHASREGYGGMILYRAGDAHHWENWSLDAAASSGAYVAMAGGRGLPDTQIVLRDGKVTVLKPRAAGAEQATEPAPANYIPEGLMHLVIAEMAKASAPARFRFLYNPEAIVEGQLYFTYTWMSPQGGGKVRVRNTFFGGESDDLYHVDATGEVVQIDNRLSGATTRLVDLRTLAGDFPEVLDIQRELESGAEESGVDLPGDESDSLPPPEPLEAGL